jgi:hypothetical protein
VSETRVWTPSQDPRNIKATASAPIKPPSKPAEMPQTRIFKSAPAASVAPKAKSVELPQTRVKPAPAPQPPSPAKVPRVKAAPKVSYAKIKALEVARQVELLKAEHGFDDKIAGLVARSEWTLEVALRHQRLEPQRQARRVAVALGERTEANILKTWMDEKVELVRINATGTARGILVELSRFEFTWAGEAEPAKKIQTLALFSQHDYERWSSGFEVREEVRAEARMVAASRRERPKFGLHWLDYAFNSGHRFRFTLLDGTCVDCYVRWIGSHSVGISDLPEPESATGIILHHGILAVHRLRPELTDAEPAQPHESRCTRSVIENPFSKLKGAQLAFVKSYE